MSCRACCMVRKPHRSRVERSRGKSSLQMLLWSAGAKGGCTGRERRRLRSTAWHGHLPTMGTVPVSLLLMHPFPQKPMGKEHWQPAQLCMILSAALSGRRVKGLTQLAPSGSPQGLEVLLCCLSGANAVSLSSGEVTGAQLYPRPHIYIVRLLEKPHRWRPPSPSSLIC